MSEFRNLPFFLVYPHAHPPPQPFAKTKASHKEPNQMSNASIVKTSVEDTSDRERKKVMPVNEKTSGVGDKRGRYKVWCIRV